MAKSGTTYTTVQGDGAPAIAMVLKDRNGAVSLSTATGVLILVEFAAGVKSFTAIIDADQTLNKGKITYSPAAVDMAEAGTWRMRTVVTWANTSKETFPNDTYDSLTVLEKWVVTP